jgi:excinuclease UvrABC nuclease subunit
VRDEAHRFAQAYHHLLRSKQLKPRPKPKKQRTNKSRKH